MKATRHSTMRRFAAAAAVIAAASLSVAAPAAAQPAADPPKATPQTKAQAILTPSIVFIQTTWSGWVKFPNGNYSSGDAIQAVSNCSGFVADSHGYVATAGHCVDGGKEAIITRLVLDAVANGTITESSAQEAINYGLDNWQVVGKKSGSAEPDVSVDVYQNVAASGIAVSTGMEATVVDFKPFEDGDVAVLKVQPSTPMPAVEVAKTVPDNGSEVIAAGYPGSVFQSVDVKLKPDFKTGTVSSNQTREGVPFTEIDAPITQGMSGGPVIDLDGKVVGTVSWGPGDEDKDFGFMTDTKLLRSMLQSNGVSMTLSATDRAYREGLADYFAGRYHAAAEKFDQVLSQQPNHAQAQAYRAKAIASYGQEPLTSQYPWLLWAGVGGMVLLLAVGITIPLALVRRSRRKTRVVQQVEQPLVAAGHFGAPSALPTPAGPFGSPYPEPQPAEPPVAPHSAPPFAPTSPGPFGSPYPAPQSAPPFVPPQPSGPPMAPEPAEPLAAPMPTATQPAPPLAPAQATGHEGTGNGRDGQKTGYCPSCGTQHSAGARFCASCGQPFETAAQSSGDRPNEPSA